ncbi:MAG: prolipoprotein diacylglyceryl transferase [Oscillospiraceae bacterium]|jgi:phosphatidylglycerol:prolipoprotein diacylglycerol transferase|nr:prolipoprotein diacylglyceryl transferase [Oscillospiraceae bacterium]
MLPFIYVFGLTVPMYWLAGLTGGGLAALLAHLRRGRYSVPGTDVTHIILFAAVGAVAGAKLLSLLVMLANPAILPTWRGVYLELTSGGGVFYGGLIGAVLLAYAYIRKYKIDLTDAAALLTPSVTLFHGFGRIGCFMAGCCYGESVSWGIVYEHSVGSPNGVPLLPAQLIEAAFNFALTALFCLWKPSAGKRKFVFPLYLLLYSAERFILEFFRGDDIRGKFLVFTTSQWIALAVFCVCGAWFRKSTAEIRKKENLDNL